MTVTNKFSVAVLGLALTLPLAACSQAHERGRNDNYQTDALAKTHAEAHYIANAGVMAVSGTCTPIERRVLRRSLRMLFPFSEPKNQ